jgi:predicted peroxiredoxin/TusA-related sulfurtransferase
MFKFLTIIITALSLMGCATHKPYLEALPMSKISANESIDMRVKKITTFILYHAVEKLQDMKEGEVLEVITENFDPIESDIKAWCRMTGHRLVELEKEENYQRYYIEKATLKEKEKKLALVISDPGLEELLSPLGFALGAALGQIDVYIYFQGPAVKVLKKDFKEKLHGINRFFSSFARKGLADIGHIPPQDKLRQLKELGVHFYICGPSMEHFGVKKNELIFDDVIVAEYLTFMEIMDKADIHIFLQ